MKDEYVVSAYDTRSERYVTFGPLTRKQAQDTMDRLDDPLEWNKQYQSPMATKLTPQYYDPQNGWIDV